MNEDFIRDMVGYGRGAPDPRWPNGARLVSLILDMTRNLAQCASSSSRP